MRHAIFGGWERAAAFLLLFFFAFLMVLPPLLSASESCSMLGGKCRDACGKGEKAEAGDFEDCGAKQDCCVVFVETPLQCCVASLDAKNFGPANCTTPVNGVCPKGSGSPLSCPKLKMCSDQK
jgi:hypothetical protein